MISAADSIDREQLRSLVTWLSGWAWPVIAADAVRLVEERGWQLEDEVDPDGSAQWTTGLIASKAWAFDTVVDGVVATVTVVVANVRETDDTSAVRRLRDIFAEQVSTTSELVGEPRTRTPGPEPTAAWVLPDGAALSIGVAGRICTCGMTSPEFVEIGRRLQDHEPG